MAKSNLQVRISPEMEKEIDKFAPKSRSSFIREAIEEKIRRETNRKRVEKWIEALKKNPEDLRYAEDWVKAESWGPK